MSEDCNHADQARQLMLIVRELKELGLNPPLVLLSDDGVSQMDMTLTDELFLIAVQLDYDAAMAPNPKDET